MFNNKGQSLIGIIIVLVVVGIIGGGLYFYLSQQIPEVPKSTEKPLGETVPSPQEKVETPTPPEESAVRPEEKPTPSPEKKTTPTPTPEEKPTVQECSEETIYRQEKCVPKNILIFVDETTYQQLGTKINRLAEDIKSDLGVNVSVQHSNYTTPIQIRNIIKDYYNNGLIGSILIGDIPTFHSKSSSYYTDWFYKELSDRCAIDNDGKFVYESGNCTPVDPVTQADVFVGRITPPVSGSEGIALIGQYLDKDHNYRLGKINFNQKMLVYPSIGVEEMSAEKINNNLNYAISKLYNFYNRNQIDMIAPDEAGVVRSNYLQKLSENSYEVALVKIHGNETSQSTSLSGNNYITWEDIKNISPDIFFVRLLSCANGAFLNENYLAGWLLFSGNTLIVESFTTPTAVLELLPDSPANPSFFTQLNPLVLGAINGDVSYGQDSDVPQTFGDPTLKMREISKNKPDIYASTKLDFGEVIAGKSKSLIYTIQNKGNTPLKLRYMGETWFSINGKSPIANGNIQYAPGLNFQGFTNLSVVPYLSEITINPGDKKDIEFGFAPSFSIKTGKPVTGQYYSIARFLNNDPNEQPYLEIQLTGTGVTQ